MNIKRKNEGSIFTSKTFRSIGFLEYSSLCKNIEEESEIFRKHQLQGLAKHSIFSGGQSFLLI